MALPGKLKFKKDLSISTGLVFYLLGVVAATSILIIISLYWFLSRHGDQELSKKVKEYCYYLESSIDRPLWLYDEETLVLTADNFFKSAPIASLKVLDVSEENVLYENYSDEKGDMVSYHGNIIYRGELIGSIKIGLSAREYRKNLNRIIFSVIFVVCFISTGLLVFILVFIGSYIKRPLMTLIDGINAISEGDYDYRFKKYRQLEFDQITQAFHEMGEEVNKREKSLRKINERLTLEIDERKKIENALRESEDKFRRLAQTTSAGIMVYQDDKWVYSNSAAERITGFSTDELRTMFFWEIVAPVYRDSVREKGERRQRNMDAESGYEVVLITKFKEKKWVYIEGNTTEYMGRSAGIISIIDITERKEAESGIKEAREFIDSIINYMPSVLLGVDSGLRVRQWNKKAENRTGISSGDANGKSLEEVFPHLVSEIDKINHAIKSKKIEKVEKKEYLKDLDFYYEDITIYPVTTGNIDGAVIRIDDVTDRVRLDEAIIEAESIRQSSKAKSEFLANMSHEMRTPLNGVIGMTTLVLDTSLDEEQKEYLEIVKSSGENLLTVINDILDFSKIDAGTLELEFIEFEVRKVMDDVAEMVSASAHEKDLELIHFVDPEIPSRVKGDPARLKQILINLAGNAVKFTKKGEVVIRVELFEDLDESVSLKFYIHDTGIGIPENKIPSLFMPFEQLDGSATREYGGTGLGLAISNQLAQVMNGEIGAKSKMGKGSTFWIKIPFEKVAESELPDETEFNPLKGKRVLIVDDNYTNRLLLKNLLNFWECSFEEAENGFAALDILRKESLEGRLFDIGILDMCMPEMDGMELGKRIFTDNLIKQPVLIMMSSIAQRGDFSDLQESGFSAYLTKPVKRDQLKKCMTMVIGKNPYPDKDRILTETRVDNAEYLAKRILVVEDNPVNQQVFLKYIGKLGYEVDLVSNGKEAIEKIKRDELGYKLVFMDCQMPVMKGFEATERIRRGECGSEDIPIIAITASLMKDDRERCIRAGMNDYLSKPVTADTLEKIITKWLGKKDGDKDEDPKLKRIEDYSQVKNKN